ncbi:Uncharacterized protein PECH_002115 [Penicillium ucsense]|uniref:Mitochondrial ATPase inhibitor n=1 Tax=Penicillium ucsense TaxID=2839758 RepID=A0A8J8WIN5_9EURO|nr:Uncharacterized protein PECM_007197 [Penicillium ucsense]KAF7738070.1 Uncharacterized protein PECH_002115 [Penicillium ucsense]
MSFLTSAIRASSRRVAPMSYTFPGVSSMHTSATRFSLKESDKTDRDNLSEHYEAKKEQQLKDQKAGKAAWDSEIASNSEEQVKADRGELDASEKSFQDLQQKTKSMPQQK